MVGALGAAGFFAHSSGILQFASAQANALYSIEAKLRDGEYMGNSKWPNILPSVDAIISAHMRQLITDRNGDKSVADLYAGQGLGALGIAYGYRGNNPSLDVNSQLWEAVARLQWWVYPLDVAFHLYKMGFMTGEQWKETKVRHAANFKSTDLLEQYLVERPGVLETFALFNREIWDEKAADDNLKYNHFYDDKTRSNLLKLRQVIPSVSDLIHMLIRDAFDEQTSLTLGLDDEIDRNPNFMLWARRQGLGEMPTDPNDPNSPKINWPKMYWRSHWIQMAAGQIIQAKFRFRAGRIDRYKEQWPNIKVVGDSDVAAVLRANDIAPSQRDWLSALAVPLLQIRQLRQLYVTGNFSDQQLAERFRDEGYVEDDIQSLLGSYRQQRKDYQDLQLRKELGPQMNAAANALLESVRIGSIEAGDAETQLASLWNDAGKAQLAVNAIVIRRNNDHVKAYIKSIRSEYFYGNYSAAAALDQLLQVGIISGEANRLVSIWVRQFNSVRKLASSQKIVEWVRNYMMTPEDATMRLHTIGWSNADAVLFLADASRLQVRDRERQQQAQQRAADKAAAEFRRKFPISTIKLWYVDSVIDAEQARELLYGHGLDDQAIDNYFAVWERK